MKKIKFNTDRVLGISAMVISLLTLIIFIHQTNIMREQSKLSVKPRLDFTLNESIEDTMLILQEVIENKGLGPAIIDSIYFKYQGESFDINIEKFLEEKFPKTLKWGDLPQHATMGKGTTLSPNEEKPIFTYRVPLAYYDSILSYLKMTEEDDHPFPVEVLYTSIYEDELWMANSNESEPKKID